MTRSKKPALPHAPARPRAPKAPKGHPAKGDSHAGRGHTNKLNPSLSTDFYGKRYVDETNNAAILAAEKANHIKIIPAGDPRSGGIIFSDGSYTDSWGHFHPAPNNPTETVPNQPKPTAPHHSRVAHTPRKPKAPPPPQALTVSSLLGRSSKAPHAHRFPALGSQKAR